MKHLNFFIENWRFLTFGIVANLIASSGQTYFISIFGGELRREFSLTNGDFGLIYMTATIASAISIIWLGRLIDRMDLRIFTALTCIGMISAVLSISSAQHILMLGFAFYLLRLTGQGLMNHIAMTSMGRYFAKHRGIAIGLTSFGDTIGLAVYPLLGALLIGWFGWRYSWLTLGIVYLVALIPLMLWLLKGHGIRHLAYRVQLQNNQNHDGSKTVSKPLHLILKEARFYFIMPAILSPPFLMTGLIFHQIKIMEIKGWSISIFTSGFIGLATTTFLTSLLLGPLVDRWHAINLLPFILLPLSIGLLILNISNADYVGFLYLIFLGMSIGATFTVTEALWPELYGTIHLGAIKAFIRALVVFISALAPWVFGLLFDMGFLILEISLLSIFIIIVSSFFSKIMQLNCDSKQI